MPILPPDILHEIMTYLRRPLPSAHTYISDRSLMRQQDLANALRVCKDYYNAAAPVLYKVVVTDDFPTFLYRPIRAGIPNIIPKLELLASVQRLFIEYSYKDGEYYNTSQEAVRWVIESMESELGDKAAELLDDYDIGWGIQVAEEARRFSSALGGIRGWVDLTRPSVFRQLRTLALGAFFGEDEAGIYGDMEGRGRIEEWDGYERVIREAQLAFRQFVTSTRSLQHYCQITGTPIAIGNPVFIPGKTDNNPTIAFHSHFTTTFSHYMACGLPTSTYLHGSQWTGGSQSLVRNYMATQADTLSKRRDVYARGRGRKKLDWRIDATVYRALPSWIADPPAHRKPSDDRDPPKNEEEKEAWRVESEVVHRAMSAGVRPRKKALPEGIDPVDRFAFKQLFDAPDCPACDWKYQENEPEWP